jgi:hypothetical protein
VQGAEDDLMVKAESAFMHDFLVDRLERIICDGGFPHVVYDATPECELLVDVFNEAGNKCGQTIRFSRRDIDSAAPANCLRLVEECGAEPGPQPAVALRDLFDQLRLTRFAGRLTTYGRRLIIHYAELSTAKLLQLPNRKFGVLCAPYATSG